MPAFRLNSLRDTYGAGQQAATAEQQAALSNALALRQEERQLRQTGIAERKEQRETQEDTLKRLGQLASPLVMAYHDALDAGAGEEEAKAAVAPYYAQAGQLAMKLGLADEWDADFNIEEAKQAAAYDPDFMKVWNERQKADRATRAKADEGSRDIASIMEDPLMPRQFDESGAVNPGYAQMVGRLASPEARKAYWEERKDKGKTYNIPNEEESFLLHNPQFDLTTEEGKSAALKWLKSPEGQTAWKAEKARKKADAIEIAGARVAAGEAARAPERARDDEIGMAKEYEAASKPFVNIKNIFEPAAKYAKGVETGRVNPSPAQDRDFVISFLKTITPTQAPEKWTMMNIDQLPPLPTRILRGIQNLVQGRQLDDQTRAEMAAAMFSRFETYNSDQAALEEATLRRAQNYGFKSENVVPRHHAIRPGGKKSEGGMGAPKTAEELLRQKGLLK